MTIFKIVNLRIILECLTWVRILLGLELGAESNIKNYAEIAQIVTFSFVNRLVL